MKKAIGKNVMCSSMMKKAIGKNVVLGHDEENSKQEYRILVTDMNGRVF